jgi:uncharacterized protein YbjT (DUF2867 family)
VADEYADKELQERIVSTSGLDWTLVRPTVLTDGPAHPWVAARQLAFAWWRNVLPPMISRASVARFIVDEVERPSWARQPVLLSGPGGATGAG